MVPGWNRAFTNHIKPNFHGQGRPFGGRNDIIRPPNLNFLHLFTNVADRRDRATRYVREKFSFFLLKTATQSPTLSLDSQSERPRIEVTFSGKLLQIYPLMGLFWRICVQRSSMVSNIYLVIYNFKLSINGTHLVITQRSSNLTTA